MNVRRFLKTLIGLPAVLMAACGSRPAAGSCGERRLVEHLRGRPRPGILFVGNSYSFGVPRALVKHAARHGVELHADKAAHSGWTLARHAGDEETLRKIRERKWDVVVLQEQSRIPSRRLKRDAAMVPAVRQLADEVCRQGATPVLYQTWGRRDGDSKRARDDFHAMNRRVRAGYRHASRKAGGLLVIPVGDAWEREVDAGRGARLFLEDGSHPSQAGDELTARVVFEMLFPDAAGKAEQ